jgi:GNAT superfamily N-acetyltransferase
VRVSELTEDQIQEIADIFAVAHDELQTRRGGTELLIELFGEAPTFTSEATRGHLASLATHVILLGSDRRHNALGLIRLEGDTGHLCIYVRPEGRSQGRGAALFGSTLQEARLLGAQRFDVLVLPGDRPMKQVCEKAGLKARKLTMALSDAPRELDDAAGAGES